MDYFKGNFTTPLIFYTIIYYYYAIVTIGTQYYSLWMKKKYVFIQLPVLVVTS